MKNQGKVTRVKLDINQADDFILFGLVSSEPDYKLSLLLNRKLRISLKNISPVRLEGNNGSELLFSRFSDSSSSPEKVFNLISNRSDKKFLINKLKNIDFIFLLQDPDNENIISQITSSLREITSITAVFYLEIDSIKDKNLNYIIQ
jgi:hypothetical protein